MSGTLRRAGWNWLAGIAIAASGCSGVNGWIDGQSVQLTHAYRTGFAEEPIYLISSDPGICEEAVSKNSWTLEILVLTPPPIPGAITSYPVALTQDGADGGVVWQQEMNVDQGVTLGTPDSQGVVQGSVDLHFKGGTLAGSFVAMPCPTPAG